MKLIRSHPQHAELHAALKKYTAPPRIHPNQQNLLVSPRLPPSPPPPKAPLLKRFPDTPPLLESRPRLHVAGRRRVPVLVNGNGTPFLRIKKPQPAFLSKVLRDRTAIRQKRVDTVQRLEKELVLAKDEDEWDGILRTVAGWEDPDYGVKDGEKDGDGVGQEGEAEMVEAGGKIHKTTARKERKETTGGNRLRESKARNKKRTVNLVDANGGVQWVDAIHASIQEVWEHLQKATADNARRGRAMWEIVKRETELAEKERKERRMRKNAEKRERKREAREKEETEEVVVNSDGEFVDEARGEGEELHWEENSGSQKASG